MLSSISTYLNGRGSNILKNTTVLFLGSAGAQILPILFLPVITRLFTPADLGVLHSIESMAHITLVVCALSYERAFVVAATAVDRNVLLFVSVCIASLMSIVGTVITINLVSSDPTLSTMPLFVLCALLLPIFFGKCFFRVFVMYGSSLGFYTDVSKSELTRTSGMLISRLALGVLQTGVIGLLVSTLAGSIFGIFRILRNTATVWIHDIKRITPGSALATAFRYRHFPLYEAPGEFCSALSERLPIIFLGFIFGPSAAGHYAVALLFVSRPIGILVDSAGTVIRTDIGKLGRGEKCASYQTIRRSLTTLHLATLSALLFVAVVSPAAFPLIFGKSWSPAGVIAALIAPLVFSTLLLRPVTGSLSSAGRLKSVLVVKILMLMVIIVSLVVAAVILNFSIEHTIAMMSLSTFLFGLVAFFILKRQLLDVLEYEYSSRQT